LDAGIRLFDSGQYDAAIPEFEAAYEAEHQPGPLVNMALCYEKLDRPEHPNPTAIPSAIGKLRQVLDVHSSGLPQDRRAWVESKLAALVPLVGQLVLRVEPASAKVLVGTVEIDPKLLSQPIAVRSGAWPIRAELEGYSPAQASATVTSGATSTVELRLEATTGELVVVPSANDAYVELDRHSLQQGVWRGRLSSGTHEVRVLRTGEEPRTLQLLVVPGKSFRVTQKPSGEFVTDAPTIGAAAAVGAKAPASPDQAKQAPAPEQPSNTGFELLASSAILWAVHKTQGPDKEDGSSQLYSWQGDNRPVGVALGVGAGYRTIDWLGIVLRLEYGATWGDGDMLVDGNAKEKVGASYQLQTWRVMGGLRGVYPPNSVARLVVEATTGGAYSSLTWTREDDKFDTAALAPQATYFQNAAGFDVLADVDVGLEIDFHGLFLDIVLQDLFQMSRGLRPKGAEASVFNNSLFWFVGPAIRPGYKFF